MVSTDDLPRQRAMSGSPSTDQVSPDFGQASLGGASQPVDSILVADCGSSFTRVSLLERVETGFCFVAHATTPTTVEPPWSDVSIGVRHAFEQIGDTTGRMLLDETGWLLIPQAGGRGVDLFVLTCSAGQPLRVVLAGLVRHISLASLARAATSAYTDVLGVIARDYVGSPDESRASDLLVTNDSGARAEAPPNARAGTKSPDEEKIAFIRKHQPEVVWVAGGTDGGSREPVRELVEAVALACTLTDSSPRPTIIYAGNAELRSEIVELIGEEVELQVIDNVRPALDTENLATAQAAFQAAYVQRKVQQLPGIETLVGWSNAPVLSTAQALSYLVMYMERLYASGKGVLCADVGSANTTVAASFPARLLSPRYGREGDREGSQHTLRVGSDLGVGYGAQMLLDRVGVDAIARWLPFEPDPGEIEQVLLNKHVRPTTVPLERRQLLIEQAAARQALRLIMYQARATWYGGMETSRRWLTPWVDPIIASGGILVQAPRPSQTVLMLLDAVEPIGVTTVVLDKQGLASVLGAVAVTQPLAAVQTLDAGAFQTLGTIVAPVGRARPGDVIMQVRIHFEGDGELEIEVRQGSLEMVPLRIGERARLELRPRRGISVGRVGRAIEITGGAVGLVIDARGRPLRFPPSLDACRELVQQWLWDMGA